MKLAELSGRFLAAIVRRNALFVGQADFLYLSGVTYKLGCQGGEPLPAHPLTRDEVKAGHLECSDIRVDGKEIDTQNCWYWCIVDDYVLDVLLLEMLERTDGVRNACQAGIGYRDFVERYLKRGKP